MSGWAWVGLAALGGVGAVARLMIGSAVVAAARGGPGLLASFPLGTAFVNLTGSFALGLLIGALVGTSAGGAGAVGGAGADTALFIVGTGLLGSYSTFSSWMLETALLAEWRRRTVAAAYLLLSLAIGLGAVALGRLLATALT